MVKSAKPELNDAQSEAPVVVGRDFPFQHNANLIQLRRGQVLQDHQLIQAARAAGVPLQPISEAGTHVLCPHCGGLVNVSAPAPGALSPMQIAALVGGGRR